MATDKGLNVADLLEAPGLTSSLRERLQAADANGDGVISASEMIDVIQSEITATRDRKMMKRVLIALGVACLLVIAAVVGLTYAVVEMSKDTSVENNVLVGKDGLQPLSTATLQQTTPLRDLYKASGPSQLQGLTHLTVPFGNGTGIFRIQDVFLVPGQRVRFDTAAEGVSVEVTAEGVTVYGDEQAPGDRRRLMQDGDDDPGTVSGFVSQNLITTDSTTTDSTTTDSTTTEKTDFYFASNGVTVLCPEADVGDTGILGGTTYTKRKVTGRNGLKKLVLTRKEGDLVTSCTSGVTSMSELFQVRFPPSRVLPLLRRRIVVVARRPSPRSEIAAHSPRPPVPRCAIGCQCLQPAHRWLGHELGDEHG
jgi:hypothetical protein